MEGMASALSAEWQRVGAQTVEQQQRVGQALEGAALQLDRSMQVATQALDERSSALLVAVQETVAQSHKAQVVADQQRLEGWSRSMEGMASTLSAEWQRAGERAVAQQQGVCQALEATAAQITERMTEQVARISGRRSHLDEVLQWCAR